MIATITTTFHTVLRAFTERQPFDHPHTRVSKRGTTTDIICISIFARNTRKIPDGYIDLHRVLQKSCAPTPTEENDRRTDDDQVDDHDDALVADILVNTVNLKMIGKKS